MRLACHLRTQKRHTTCMVWSQARLDCGQGESSPRHLVVGYRAATSKGGGARRAGMATAAANGGGDGCASGGTTGGSARSRAEGTAV